MKSRWGGFLAVTIIVGLLLEFLVGPFTTRTTGTLQPSAVQQAHAIGLAMAAYADSHNGIYPDGETSTEVFQKLLDGHYIEDPTIFFHRSVPGKTKATTTKLTANNVCFDVTSGVTRYGPVGLPIVFSSGYIVSYVEGADAVLDPRLKSPFDGDGMAVGFTTKDYPGGLIFSFRTSGRDGSITSFIPADFNAGGKTYRQLRP